MNKIVPIVPGIAVLDLIPKWGSCPRVLSASSRISKLPDPFCIIPAVTLSPKLVSSGLIKVLPKPDAPLRPIKGVEVVASRIILLLLLSALPI